MRDYTAEIKRYERLYEQVNILAAKRKEKIAKKLAMLRRAQAGGNIGTLPGS